VRVVVLGGTGVVGRHVVAAAAGRGLDVLVASRHGTAPDGLDGLRVDVGTGSGLGQAFHLGDVVVDATNTNASRARAAREHFRASAGHVTRVAREAGAERVVVLSIVGIDPIPYGYYEGKVAQEQAYLASEVPVTILRATQFHEFAGQVLARSTFGPIAFVPRLTVQPVAAADVASALLDAALAPFEVRAADLAGPEVLALPDLAKKVLAARGASTRVVTFRLPGRAGQMMADDALLPTSGTRSSLTFDAWLARQSSRAS